MLINDIRGINVKNISKNMVTTKFIEVDSGMIHRIKLMTSSKLGFDDINKHVMVTEDFIIDN